jgi:hypothetical protein
VFRITGASPPAEDTSKTVKYSTSANATENTLNYNGSISIPAAQTGGLTWIKLMLYDGSTLLDGPETIPIVQDGQDGKKGDKGDPGIPGSAAGVAKYLGKTVNTTNTSSVVIKYTDTYSLTVTANVGDWVSYVGTSLAGTSPWQKNYCLQWRGTQEGWVKLDPLSSEFTAHYMEALNDITEGAIEGVFSWIMTRKIMATEAFIDYLSAMEIQLNQRIINGKLETGSIRSNNYIAGVRGFKINYDGDAEFSNATVRGHIEAKSGTFKGELQAATGTFAGELQAAKGTFAGELQAAKGTFAGALTANSITISGSHVAGAAATAASNQNVIAYDNVIIDENTTVSFPGFPQAKKRLRIAGKGTCRFHLNIRGRWEIGILSSNGNLTTVVSSTSTASTSELWTGIISLPENINIFYLTLISYAQTTLSNTTFEAVTSTEPGLFKYMSSPL